MLTHINIRNFAIIEHWDIDLTNGLTVVTGESGAGKSILIDAVELGLGARADSSNIRQGAKRAEITLTFDISNLPKVQQWLQEQDYDDDNQNECIIRRIITDEGRSRVSINDTPCTLQQVKTSASLLINIHGQHQNQSLLNKTYQLEIIDYYANHPALTQKVKTTYRKWQDANQQLQKLQNHSDNFQAQVDLLQYQVSELDEFDLQADEYHQLDQEQKNLANAEQYLSASYQALQQLNNDDSTGIINQLHYLLNKLSAIKTENASINNALELINNAVIQCEEAGGELQNFSDHFNVDPERLNEVEHRLETIFSLARKHHVEPSDLYDQHQSLQQELDSHLNASSHIAELKQELSTLEADFAKQATALFNSRDKAAKQLAEQVSNKIQILGMKGGQFAIQWHKVHDSQPHIFGSETAEFLVSANPGQPLQALNKVASGGELSRIALAIQVIASQTMTTPSLIFDEVDVGIGGNTAAIVGQILLELSEATQVFCITHQPQVAAAGTQHLHVQKTSSKESTSTELKVLTTEQRVEEIARMLGGLTITDKTRNNAKELLSEV